MDITKEQLVQPFFIQKGKTGILLVHGFTASPIDMKPMGEKLSEYGYTIYAPLLSGHGQTPEEMRATSWQDWEDSADQGLEQLKKSCTKVLAVGHSMGGLIVLSQAAQRKLDGVIAINAPMVYQEKELHFADRLLGKQEYVLKSHKDSEISTNREGLPHYSYTKVPVECFVSLNRAIIEVQDNLCKIACPVLVVQSLKDKIVHPKSSRIIEKSVKHRKKDVIYWANEDHYLPLSSQREKLFERINHFIKKFELN